jgi:hypothetical protein
MKKILLTLFAVIITALTYAQVVVAGISPQSALGNYSFTIADWGSSPTLQAPGEFVEGELAIAFSDTLPWPSGALACNLNISSVDTTSGILNNIAGKIAVVYRGACNFSQKAYNCQLAGAIAVIIVNSQGAPVGMAGGTLGGLVTIPVVMISTNDGNFLTSLVANEPVTMFMGNKTGLYTNDIGFYANGVLKAYHATTPSYLATNSTEYNIPLGGQVFNFGSAVPANATFSAIISDPNGTEVYNQSANLNLGVGLDTADVSLPAFNMASYPIGTYTLTYKADIPTGDDETSDNIYTTTFSISDSQWGYAQMDTVNMPSGFNYYRGSSTQTEFQVCSNLSNENSSRLIAEGIYFSAAAAAATDSLDGEEIVLSLFEWADIFVDVNDPMIDFTTLNEVASGYYTFGNGEEYMTVYGEFDAPAVLEDGKRYLACVLTPSPIYFGYEGDGDLSWNYGVYQQPIAPLKLDGTWYFEGFGTDVTPAMTVKVSENDANVTELPTINGSAYPNPTSDKINIALNTTGKSTITVTDISGKIVLTTNNEFNGTELTISIEDFESGLYIFSVTLENGKTAQFNVVKK